MKYCAFLRGVNVKGTNMKMAEVCNVFEAAGMRNVASVLASGNIIFTSEEKKEALKTILEEAMSAHFQYEAFMFIKTEKEVADIKASIPFEESEDAHIYAFLGIDDVEKTLNDAFEKAEKSPQEDAKIVANTFYWKVSKGATLDSAFGKILGKKNLKDSFTSRNINTLEKVLKKFG